jgi:hypothetical protein
VEERSRSPRFSRRLALRSTALLVGSAFTVKSGVPKGLASSAPRSAIREFRFVYYLDPTASAATATRGESKTCSRGCEHCSACHKHAEAKLWAGAQYVRRAHPGCRCVVKSRLVPEAAFRRLFPGQGTSAAKTEWDVRRSS